MSLLTSLFHPGAVLSEELHDRQLLAVFTDGTTILPGNQTSGELAEAIAPESDITGILASYGVSTIERAFPNFDRADTIGVAYTGESVRLTDWSQVWLITIPDAGDLDACIGALSQSSSTIFAEPNGAGVSFGAPQYPSDPKLKDGTQWGLWTPNNSASDTRGPWAWGWSTGNANVRIGIIDGGFDGSHPDLGDRVFFSDGTGADSRHAFMIAGIAGAKTDNAIGMSGVDWNARLVSVKGGYNTDDVTTINAINKAGGTGVNQLGARVLNASWGLTFKGEPYNSRTVQQAFKDHYALNGITVAAVGNYGSPSTKRAYPANYKIGVIGVGAHTQTGDRWNMSATGPAVDILAPGVGVEGLTEAGGYIDSTGTSFAAPYVAGTAALLFARNTNLNADDIEQLIRLSATDVAPAGYDTLAGYGRLNIERALSLIDLPNKFVTGVRTVPYSQLGQGGDISTNAAVWDVSGTPNVPNGNYSVTQRELFVDVAFPSGTGFTSPPSVWGLGGGKKTSGWARLPTVGTPQERLLMDYRHSDASLITTSQFRLTTYIYEIPAGSGHWYPSGVGANDSYEFAWSALQITPTPSATQSFFVPQSGAQSSPTEGLTAARLFRICPNNDGTSSLPSNARLKIVVKDSNGSGIAGVAAQEIFALFNGGTDVQGFYGDGADSVIASSNSPDACPQVRALYADGPTDANGITYITLTGSQYDAQGSAIRSSDRKWGHYDTEIPVFIRGVRISGRLTSSSLPTDPPYAFQVRGIDFVGGTSAGVQGETVTASEYNVIVYDMNNHTYDFWEDLNGDGSLTSVDLNIVWAHLQHRCGYPLAP